MEPEGSDGEVTVAFASHSVSDRLPPRGRILALRAQRVVRVHAPAAKGVRPRSKVSRYTGRFTHAPSSVESAPPGMYSNIMSHGWLRVHAPRNCEGAGDVVDKQLDDTTRLNQGPTTKELRRAAASYTAKIASVRISLLAHPCGCAAPIPVEGTHLYNPWVVHVRHDRNFVAQLADGACTADVNPARCINSKLCRAAL